MSLNVRNGGTHRKGLVTVTSPTHTPQSANKLSVLHRLEYYLSIRDIQMLGMLSCILSHHSLPDSFKPSKPRHPALTISKSYTFGQLSHSETMTHPVSHAGNFPSIQSKIVLTPKREPVGANFPFSVPNFCSTLNFSYFLGFELFSQFRSTALTLDGTDY